MSEPKTHFCGHVFFSMPLLFWGGGPVFFTLLRGYNYVCKGIDMVLSWTQLLWKHFKEWPKLDNSKLGSTGDSGESGDFGESGDSGESANSGESGDSESGYCDAYGDSCKSNDSCESGDYC